MISTPLGYLTGSGSRADAVVPLTWFTLLVSILVCLIVTALLWIGIRRGSTLGGAAATRAVAIERGGDGLRWITVGLIISAIPLLATLIWTMAALAMTWSPPAHGLVLDVTGRQWWWQIDYNGTDPGQDFATANEAHIPVGMPVLVRLHAGDVIHSFWVPKLSGKTDAIPGQTNLSWLEAAAPGRYRGQCGEYCGVQHAHMAFEVVAEPRADFERWRARQQKLAAPPATPEQRRGLALFASRCGRCHRVRGTGATSATGPDLTHLMSRRTIAAGTLANTPGNLTGWIADPQGVKPGTRMPNVHLSGPQLGDTRAYLETLK